MSKTTTKSATDNKAFFAQYKDARWQKKRLEIMQRDGFACTCCGKGEGGILEDGVSLNVHHAYYISGMKPWEYSNDMLSTKCDTCHKKIHDTIENIKIQLSKGSLEDVIGYESLSSSSMMRFVRTIGGVKVVDCDILIKIVIALDRMRQKCGGKFSLDAETTWDGAQS